MAAELEQELATYKRLLPELLNDEGKFVLIKKNEVVEKFDSYEDALKIGYQRFGLEPFLVKQISRLEPAANFTRRYIVPCPA
ncbi:hypothetical protein [Burkholderia sp. RF4-BP95]|uniref:hypothetical protein n=1 Tax=Burkholderia sp. RF4-BP95 TaxID=1637845 RepID=UPI00075B7521|nr:hypothetical protein [Burkholderia sp. RF4-BP95]KUY70841.1 hypothetical protein WS46_32210 [Burkholderia sp. RF4-BP95]